MQSYKFKSILLGRFIEEITYNNRNPRNIRALDLINDKDTNPIRVINPFESVYRCRIIKNEDEINKEDGLKGFNAENSYIAPPEFTKDMRANYRYIPYLYCASHPYTALAEVRPKVGSLISIATIQAKERINLLDFTLNSIPDRMIESKKNLFSDLSYLFSKPITDEDDTIDYIPTQFIAEYAKNLGYDGISYRSSLSPRIDTSDSAIDEIQNSRYNIVIFNYQKCYPIKSNVVRAINHYIDYFQTDDDPVQLDVGSMLHQMIVSL